MDPVLFAEKYIQLLPLRVWEEFVSDLQNMILAERAKTERLTHDFPRGGYHDMGG